MTKRTINEYTCERCGVLGNDRNPSTLYDWGLLFGKRVNGPNIAGDIHAKHNMQTWADVCPSCIASFRKWWDGEAK